MDSRFHGNDNVIWVGAKGGKNMIRFLRPWAPWSVIYGLM